MALYGLRPVPEIQFADFIYPGLRPDRERAGEVPLPLGRRVSGAGRRSARRSAAASAAGTTTRSRPRRCFIHIPGLKVVCPSNPYDAKGLLASAIRGDDPVIFIEPKRIYRAAKGEVPEGDYTIPLGEAQGRARGRAGARCIAWGAMVHAALEAAAAGRGAAASIWRSIDLRTLLPFDIETILASVQEDRARGDRPRGAAHLRLRRRAGGDRSQEKAILHLEAPILRVTGFDTPFPYTLEHEYLPDADRIARRGRAGGELHDASTSSSCPTSAKASSRARSSAGWSRRATRSPRTSRWSRS